MVRSFKPICDKVDRKRCDEIITTLKLSPWLQGSEEYSSQAITESIRNLKLHLNSNCDCVPNSSTYILIAVNYYYLFFTKIKKFNAMEQKQCDIYYKSQDEEKIDDDSKLLSPVSNPSANEPSLFESISFSNLVNFETQNILISPLRKSIDYFLEAFKDNKVNNNIPLPLITGLEINSILVNCFYIFSCYDIIAYQYQSAKLLFHINHDILTKTEDCLLNTYHFMIRIHLDYGAIERAKRFLLKAKSLMAKMGLTKKNMTFESALILLDTCEIDLKTGNEQKAKNDLSEFLKCDYLSMLTLNRYYLKAKALYLASQFPPSFWEFSENFREFLEPTRMTACVLNRWHTSYFSSSKTSKEKAMNLNKIDVDPIWFRYLMYKFSFKLLVVAMNFYLSVGFPLDFANVFNPLFRVYRFNCFFTLLLKCLMIGNRVDKYCDKKHAAIIKLQEAASMIKNTNVLDFESKNIPLNPINNTVVNSLDLENEYPINNPIYEHNFEAHDVEHLEGQNLTIFERKKLLTWESTDEQIDGSMLSFPSISEHAYPLNVFALNLSIDSMLLNSDSFNLETIQKFYHSIPEITTRVGQVLTQYLGCRESDVNLYYLTELELYKIYLADLITGFYMAKENYTEVVKLLKDIFVQFQVPIIGYELRTSIGMLILKYLQAKCKIAKVVSSITEYDVKVAEDLKCSSSATCRTPEHKITKVNLPNAPKNKVHYKMDEFKEYIDNLQALPSNKPGLRLFSNSEENISEMVVSEQSQEDSNNYTFIKTRSETRIEHNLKENTIKDKIINFDNDDKKVEKNENIDKQAVQARSSSFKLASISVLTRSKSSPDLKFNDSIEADLLSDCLVFLTKNISLENDPVERLLNVKNIEYKNDIEYLISLSKCLLNLFENNPPFRLYSEIQKLLFKLFSSVQINDKDASFYHFSEATNATSLRYRGIVIKEKKKSCKLEMPLPTEKMIFSKKDCDAKIMKEIIKDIPEDWRLVQIMADGGPIYDLIICRYQKNRKPIFIKIKGNSEKFTNNFVEELNEILKLSNASIENRDAVSFWNVRTALNKRFESLMSSVSNVWLGPIKALFIGQPDSKYSQLCEKILNSLIKFFGKPSDLLFLEAFVESIPFVQKEQFIKGMNFLYPSLSSSLLGKTFTKAMKVFNSHYKTLDINFGPIGFVISKQLEIFPFESLSPLNELVHEVFRVPSLRFLSIILEASKKNVFCDKINQDNTYYLLNPAGNLPKSEGRFKNKFCQEKTWIGSIGTPPVGNVLKNALEMKDLYIYFGHGAGSAYYRSIPNGLEGANIRSAALVIGCSSGRLMSDSNYCDSYGVAYRFLLNGSPTFVGVLWDVTDKDIDKFADRLLLHLIPNWINETNEEVNKYSSLCKAIWASRKACKLKYLIGAAPVVYGLPISFRS